MRSMSDYWIGAPSLSLPFSQQRPLLTGSSSIVTVCRFPPGLLALLLFFFVLNNSYSSSRELLDFTPPPSVPPTPTGSCRVLLSGEGHDTRAQQTHNTAALAAIMVQFVARHHHSWWTCKEEPWRERKELLPFVLGCWWPAAGRHLVSISSTNPGWITAHLSMDVWKLDVIKWLWDVNWN